MRRTEAVGVVVVVVVVFEIATISSTFSLKIFNKVIAIEESSVSPSFKIVLLVTLFVISKRDVVTLISTSDPNKVIDSIACNCNAAFCWGIKLLLFCEVITWSIETNFETWTLLNVSFPLPIKTCEAVWRTCKAFSVLFDCKEILNLVIDNIKKKKNKYYPIWFSKSFTTWLISIISCSWTWNSIETDDLTNWSFWAITITVKFPDSPNEVENEDSGWKDLRILDFPAELITVKLSI